MRRVVQFLTGSLLLLLASMAQSQSTAPELTQPTAAEQTQPAEPELTQPIVPDLTIDAPDTLTSAAKRVEAVNFARLEEALERAGLELPPRIHVRLIEEDQRLARATPPWIVALASGQANIVLFPSRVVRYPYDSIESVVRHEIVHLALTTRARGRPMPRWFHEGVAVSVDSGFGVGSQLRLLGVMIGRPEIDELGRLFAVMRERSASDAYLLSAALVDDVRQRHGAAVPGTIAGHVARGVPFARAFQLETGETPDEAAAVAWASYRRWTTWVAALTSGSAMWGLIIGLAVIAYAARARQRRRRRRLWDEEEA